MSENHQKYHYSLTCHTDDPVVLHCLRAIAQFVEKGQYPQIGWDGTTRKAWKQNNQQFTVRFTSPYYRDAFIQEAQRLVSGRWSQISSNDNDPAKRQR